MPPPQGRPAELHEIFGVRPVVDGAGNPTLHFPRRAWSPDHLAIAVATEFVRQKRNGKDWSSIVVVGPYDAPAAPGGSRARIRRRAAASGRMEHPLTKQSLAEEVAEPIRLIEYRPGVMAEALMQRDQMLAYWRGLLSSSRISHPATFELLRIAAQIGQFMAHHFKWMYQFPRPSSVAPALMPEIDPPGHASYPSAHAAESYLIGEVLKKVMPAEGGGGTPVALDRMAERISRNREVLGVHFPRDSAAGKDIAGKTLPFLLACPTVVTLLAEAQGEWAPSASPRRRAGGEARGAARGGGAARTPTAVRRATKRARRPG